MKPGFIAKNQLHKPSQLLTQPILQGWTPQGNRNLSEPHDRNPHFVLIGLLAPKYWIARKEGILFYNKGRHKTENY